jgi:hypothetical protein
MSTHPTPDELDEEFGLTAEEESDFRNLLNRCEVGVPKFSNNDMSLALVLIERLRGRWRLLRRALENA